MRRHARTIIIFFTGMLAIRFAWSQFQAIVIAAGPVQMLIDAATITLSWRDSERWGIIPVDPDRFGVG